MIRFFSEDTSFTPAGKRALRIWIQDVIKKEGVKSGEINYIFCSDEYLHSLNQTYLNHNTLTDIITFDQSEANDIAGDIYISIDRVKANAKQLTIPFTDELHRVMIHGILHLTGLNDKTTKEKQFMREKEDLCLSLRKNLG